MKYWQEIEREIDKNGLKIDKEKVKLAFLFAKECHIGQYRKSGDNYIIHPIEVTKILIDMKMDTDGTSIPIRLERIWSLRPDFPWLRRSNRLARLIFL